MLVGCGCVAICAAGLGAFSGGCVAVGWYPVGMWLFVGLGALPLEFSIAVATTLALAAKYSVYTFMSHVALFSTPETRWCIPVV